MSDGIEDSQRIERAYHRYCRRQGLPENSHSFYLFAIDHDRKLARWGWLRVVMIWLMAGARTGIGFFLFYLAYLIFGWLGILGFIAILVTDQLWWRYKHGRWLGDDEYMTGDDFFWWDRS